MDCPIICVIYDICGSQSPFSSCDAGATRDTRPCRAEVVVFLTWRWFLVGCGHATNAIRCVWNWSSVRQIGNGAASGGVARAMRNSVRSLAIGRLTFPPGARRWSISRKLRRNWMLSTAVLRGAVRRRSLVATAPQAIWLGIDFSRTRTAAQGSRPMTSPRNDSRPLCASPFRVPLARPEVVRNACPECSNREELLKVNCEGGTGCAA